MHLPISQSSLAAAPTFALAGGVYTILLSTESSAGALNIVHGVAMPGSGPPMHTHTREDETFFVIEGELTLYAEGRVSKAGPGASVFLPRNQAHRYVNETDRPARFLVITNPGGFDRLVSLGGSPIPPGTKSVPPPTEADIGRLVKACEEQGILLHTAAAT